MKWLVSWNIPSNTIGVRNCKNSALKASFAPSPNCLKENVPAALAGTGAVAPVFAGYDLEQGSAKIYFYDILGAEFEGVEYAVSGSGSPTIRGILHYLNTWGESRSVR